MSTLYCMKLREKDDNIILKITESYFNRIGHEHIDEFRNMLFRELDQKSMVYDKHVLNNDLSMNTANKSHVMKNGNLKLIHGHGHEGHSHKRGEDGVRIFAGEYMSTSRHIKFFISKTQECSVFINDTVMYENINNINFVEHMILHNNAENIDPKGVYSENVNINFFAFNRKLNIFSVYFDNNKIENKGKNNFTIEFDYDAINLIKTMANKDKDEDSNSNHHKITNNKTTLPSFRSHQSQSNSYNNFIWKILNQNFLKNKEMINIEIFFDLGKDFEHEDVEFSLNFTKSIIDEEKKSIVKYEWKGMIEPQEVLVLQAKFPLYFEHCGNLNINLVMIFVGSIFIIFLIGMLYIILSTVFLDEM
jgi:hypothetical protein